MSDIFENLKVPNAAGSSSAKSVSLSLKDLDVLQNKIVEIFLFSDFKNLKILNSSEIKKLFSKNYNEVSDTLLSNIEILNEEVKDYITYHTAVITLNICKMSREMSVVQLLDKKSALFTEYCEVFKKLFKGNEEQGQLIIQVLKNIRETYQEKIEEEIATTKLQPNQKGRACSCSASF